MTSDQRKAILKERLKDVAAVSTVATPFVARSFFRSRQRELCRLLAKCISGSKRIIPMSEVNRLAKKEKDLWKKTGAKFRGVGLKQLPPDKPAGYDNFFQWKDGTGRIQLSVEDLAKAKAKGVNTDVFLHELGHAHDFDKHRPSTLGGFMWRLVGGKFAPTWINPSYQEELRAWRNAKTFGKGLDEKLKDLALGTYRNAIYGNQAVVGSGALSAAIIRDRFSKKPKMEAD